MTVGTDHHRFDRLIRWTDNWLAAGGCERARCLIQIGASVEPGQAEWARYLSFGQMEALMREAAVVVSHGAGATAGLAARSGKTPIVVPRRKDLDEHVDDHQVRFARIAASRGEFALAESEEDFRALIERALERPNGSTPSRPDHLDGAVLRFEQLVDELVAPNGSLGGRASVTAASRLPSVSVVVPTRDRPDLLARALAGILGQRYEGEIECLVVFDQSDVALPPTAEQPGRSLRSLRNERKPGLAGARNTGFLHATGELVAFCDDDDEWLPDKLGTQVEALSRLPRETLMSCGIELSHPRGSRVRLARAETISLRDLLRSRHMEFHPSTFLVDRGHLLDGVGLVDEEIPGSYGEDYDWLIRAAQAGTVASVRRPLVRVNWSGSWFAGRWETIIAALQYMLAKHPEFAYEPRGLARLYGRIAFGHAVLGNGAQSRAWAMRSLGRNPLQLRAYVALVAGAGLVSPHKVVAAANRFGRGV